MAALWGNLLTKLKHIKVKHKAVSPHLIRDSRSRTERERRHKDIQSALTEEYEEVLFLF